MQHKRLSPGQEYSRLLIGQTELMQYLAAHATARRRLRSLRTWNHEFPFDIEWREAVNKPQLRDFHPLASYSYLEHLVNQLVCGV